MKTKISIMVIALTVVGLFSVSSAQVPGMINYQGMLAASDGSPLDTTVSMMFRIYADSTTSTYLWTENHDSVRVEGGMFNILLGSGSSIPDSVFDGSVRYLGLTVGSDAEMTPRRPLVSVGYAYHTLGADMADMALGVVPDVVGTEQIADGTIEFADIGNNQASPGQVIKWSDAKAGWIAGEDAVGGISGVSGGAGIIVSGSSDSVEVSIADGGVTSSMLAGNSVTSDKIANGAINTDDLHVGAVATDKLSNSAVTNEKLASDAVTNDKLSSNAVTNAKLSSNAVTNEKLSSNAVTNDKLSINAVTNEKLNANAVSAEKIQINAVTSDKIADATIQFADIGQNEAKPGQVMRWREVKGEGEWFPDSIMGITTLIAGPGITTTGEGNTVTVSINDQGVTTNMLAGNSVTSDKIENGEINTDDLQAGAVATDKLSNSAVTNEKLASNAVTNDKLSINAVTSDKLSSNAVTNDKLSINAVTNDKLSINAVTSEKLNANAVSAEKIQLNAVTSDKIEDATILFSDIGQNSAMSGQVMKWGGTAWVAADDDTGKSRGWVHTGRLVLLEVPNDTVGIGIDAPQAKLDVAGTVRMQGFEMPIPGTQAGYVLISDEGGVGTWQLDGLTLPYEQTVSIGGPAFKVRNEGEGEAVHGEGHIGVYGTSDAYNGCGVHGRTTSGGIAVWGENTSAAGFAGRFDGEVQVTGSVDVTGTVHMDGFDLDMAYTQAGYVLTSDDNGVGTWQPSTGLNLPYSGSVSTSGTAFEIDNTGNNGVGVKGRARGSGIGVYGECYNSATGVAVYGHGHAMATGIYGISSGGFAGEFEGDVEVTGTLSKGSGSFKIDHPLDPKNKYLYHSFVESPDMMNIYNGNIVLDGAGEAWINLPEWFEALNKDFRYQLTCIGGFAPVYIAEKISNNRFQISGGKPGMEVSWQVTGIRHDAFAEANRIQVQVDKPADEQGKYLHPKAFNLGEEQGIGYDKRRNLETVSEKEKIEE